MSSQSEDVRFHRWTANPKWQAIRVHATYAGVMCIVYLHRGKDLTQEQQTSASFCTRLYDSVQVPYFQFALRSHKRFGRIVPVEEDDRWLHPLKGREFMTAKDHESSNELFGLIREQLPGALQTRSSTGSPPVAGTFCYLTIDDDPEHPGQASINIQSDIFREYLLADLRVIEPEMFPNVERIDLSRIRTFHSFVSAKPRVLKIDVVQAEGDSTDELILKIGLLPDYEGPDRLPSGTEEAKRHQQLHFQELSDWSKVWGHENIMRPPKYLVTVPDGDCVRLVGWLQVVYRNWSDELTWPHRGKGDHATVRKLLGYISDLARGMLHMIKKGYIHPDLQRHNCLFAGPEHDDHLFILDFQPEIFEGEGPGVYFHAIGPDSPEVRGHWNVSLDNKGDLVYSRSVPCGPRKTFTILTDWADFPEALMRLQIFTFASVAASMLKYRSPNPEHCHREFFPSEATEAEKERTSRWESFIPDAAKTLLEECWSFDPRQRPLLEDILQRLTEIRDAMDNFTPSNCAEDQSKDVASPE